jgi:hypothetical protein
LASMKPISNNSETLQQQAEEIKVSMHKGDNSILVIIIYTLIMNICVCLERVSKAFLHFESWFFPPYIHISISSVDFIKI